MIKPYYWLLMLVIFCGCQSTQGYSPAVKRTVDVTFISFPPGAVIEVDTEYKGRTPTVITFNEYHLEQNRDISTYKVFVYPSQEEGYCMQKLALNPYDLPQQVEFDLDDCSLEGNAPSVIK